ncbi:MAG: Uma2 family endonuclease [Thermoflexibacteraceae bacterium]
MAITSIEQLNPNTVYSYADYITWQFAERIELLKGYIRQMSAPNRHHQTVSGNLHREFATYFRGKSCRVFHAPFDVKLVKNPAGKTEKDIYTVVQPDICVICDRSKLDVQGCLGSPDLIIEIVSPSSTKTDVKDKFALYQENGVLEYWIARPSENTIEQFFLENDHYVFKGIYVKEETFSPILFPDLLINVEEVFEE